MKKIIKISLFFVLFLGLISKNITKSSAAESFYNDNKNGILNITYNNKDKAKMKIGVTKGDKTYYYDLGNGENDLDIPLTLGNGTYQIRILKNIVSTKYSVVQNTTFELELKNENEVFLYPNVIVDYDITDKAIAKADSLVKGCKTDSDKIKKIYKYVVSNFSYDYDKVNQKPPYIPDIQIVFKNQKGICYDISAIMAAMLRSQGIQVKLVMGYTPNIEVYHAWNVVYDSNKKEWYTIDATYDIPYQKAGKKYTMIKKAKDYVDIRYMY